MGEPKLVTYQTRKMSAEDRQRMRVIAAKTGRKLEDVLNKVIEIGLPQVEVIVERGGW